MPRKYEYTTIFNVEDAVNTKIEVDAADILDEVLHFPHNFFRAKPYGGKKQIKTIRYVIGRNKKIRNLPTGLVPIAINYLKSKNWDVKCKGYYEKLKTKKPQLEGIKFRPDQLDAIKSILLSEWQRGIIVAPTGTGKTIIALGALSSLYPKYNTLIMAHTKDLLLQFHEDLIKFKFNPDDISYLDGKNNEFKKITLCTDKKLTNLNPKDFTDFFDIVIIDEAHHLSNFNTQYANLLRNMLAPVRIGFTATIPDSIESQWAMKSYIGPIKYELTVHKAAKLNLLTVPKVKFITYIPVEKEYDMKSYTDIYNNFVMFNRNRNNVIMDLVEYHIKRKEPTLICIKKLEHLAELMKIARRRKLPVYEAQGSTTGAIRKDIINNMRNKNYLTCVASKVFNEGINIPSLEVIINAAAGKSSIENMQKPGRGTRLADGKTSLILYDICDPYRYLSEHSIQRMLLYTEAAWKIEILSHHDIKEMLANG